MKIEITDIEKKDHKKAIQFAVDGMHFGIYFDHNFMAYLYGKYFLYSEMLQATQAIAAYQGEEAEELFAAAAQAAAQGAENSKQFVSKFGRAKSYGEKTIGTPDAGAMSMSYFFQGLAQA